MTDQTNNTMQGQLAALLQQMGQQAQAPAMTGQQPAAGAFAQPQIVQGVAVPVKLSTPAGEIRCYLSLDQAAAQSPQALMGALQMLQSQGWPIDTWQPRQQQGGGWGGGSGGGWNGGGRGYGGNRGGRW